MRVALRGRAALVERGMSDVLLCRPYRVTPDVANRAREKIGGVCGCVLLFLCSLALARRTISSAVGPERRERFTEELDRLVPRSPRCCFVRSSLEVVR